MIGNDKYEVINQEGKNSHTKLDKGQTSLP